jgi:hypothetical protein
MTPPRVKDDTRRHAAAFLFVICLAGSLAACRATPDPDAGPSRAALRLFELARVEDPTDEQLGRLVDPVPRDGALASFLDALSGLGTAADPEVIAVSRPEGPEDAFVDLAAELPGGGSARFSVRLRASGAETWRVSWFQGPGVEWPTSRAGRDQGLSTSAPPEAPR